MCLYAKTHCHIRRDQPISPFSPTAKDRIKPPPAPLLFMEKFYHPKLQLIAKRPCTIVHPPLIPFGFVRRYCGLPIAH
jgi:hypothetical protein